MNIGIDIDDTISETFETLLPYSQKYTIEDLKRKSQIDFNITCLNHFYIENLNKWNKKESTEFWEKYYAEILKKVNIKKFATEVINKLKHEGHKIYLITARWDMPSEDIKQITIEWLKEKELVYDELIINASDKVKIAKDKKIELFIDDSFGNCKELASSDIKVYMMNSKINEKLEDSKIKRVFSWPEIYDLINREVS